MTIEGGPGWQLGLSTDDGADGDGARDADTLGTEPGPADAPAWGRGRQLAALAVAAAVGFAAATVLAETRLQTLRDGPEGVLSLDVVVESVEGTSLVSSVRSQAAVVSSVVLRNTGPNDVALDAAELIGTGFVAEDLEGRRLPPGGRTVLRLLRAVDCSALDPTPPPGPLRVEATTGAGQRTVDLRVAADLAFADEQARAACGQVDPAMALIVLDSPPMLTGTTVRVSAELSNASVSPLLVSDLRPLLGLRIVATTDQQGRPARLPLELPPGDYDPPTDPFSGRGSLRVLVVELAVEDCALLPARGTQHMGFGPVLEAAVTSSDGSRRGGTGWGDGRVLDDLRRTSCPPARESQLAPVPPMGDPARVRTEQELRYL